MLVLACSIPPAVIVGVSFGFGDYITQFPPVFCASEDPNASYYLMILPLSSVAAVGVTCLVLILGLLIRRSRVGVC